MGEIIKYCDHHQSLHKMGLISISPFCYQKRNGEGLKCEIAKNRSEDVFWRRFLANVPEGLIKRDLHHVEIAK